MLRWCSWLKFFLMEGKGLFIVYNQCNEYWWPGDTTVSSDEMDFLHKSHNVHVPYPTMHRFVTKPNLVAKIWPPNLITICAWLPKLVVNVSSKFCNKNVYMCAHFCYKMVHCGIWDTCIVVCTFLLQSGALWDICLMHCGIYEISLLEHWLQWNGFIAHLHVTLHTVALVDDVAWSCTFVLSLTRMASISDAWTQSRWQNTFGPHNIMDQLK